MCVCVYKYISIYAPLLCQSVLFIPPFVYIDNLSDGRILCADLNGPGVDGNNAAYA